MPIATSGSSTNWQTMPTIIPAGFLNTSPKSLSVSVNPIPTIVRKSSTTMARKNSRSNRTRVGALLSRTNRYSLPSTDAVASCASNDTFCPTLSRSPA